MAQMAKMAKMAPDAPAAPSSAQQRALWRCVVLFVVQLVPVHHRHKTGPGKRAVQPSTRYPGAAAARQLGVVADDDDDDSEEEYAAEGGGEGEDEVHGVGRMPFGHSRHLLGAQGTSCTQQHNAAPQGALLGAAGRCWGIRGHFRHFRHFGHFPFPAACVSQEWDVLLENRNNRRANRSEKKSTPPPGCGTFFDAISLQN